MIEHELPLDEKQYESFPGMTFDFPYIWFWGEVDQYVGGYVPWHWHDEPEFCHILKGDVEYHLPGQTYVLSEGDAIFVNSNVRHMICPHNDCRGAIIIPQIFNKLLLIGYHKSDIDKKYYRPIVNSQNLECYIMRHENSNDSEMIKLLDQCYTYAKDENFGYELHVRNYISSLWLKLYCTVESQLNPGECARDKTNLLLNQMLEYIKNHYAEKISLKDIADSACISERGCIRYFQKNMQTTPLKYLQEYRIYSAANMLLHSELSITEIAFKTGFDTSSYFSKIFKEYMKCTPKTYRNTSRQNYTPSDSPK